MHAETPIILVLVAYALVLLVLFFAFQRIRREVCMLRDTVASLRNAVKDLDKHVFVIYNYFQNVVKAGRNSKEKEEGQK